MSPSLEFYMSLPREPIFTLVKGFLLVKTELGAAGIKLQALSGCTRYQYRGAWREKGRGCLPPSTIIAPTKYTVSTQRLWLPHVRGVEGSFYAIAPFMVTAAPGIQRGDFGIHFDANMPGSAGCIVLPLQDHWDVFRHLMADFRFKGIKQLPLTVKYEY